MLKRLTLAASALLIAMPLLAQEKAAPDKKPTVAKASETKAAPARTVEPLGQPVNVKIELTITDQTGPGAAARKTIFMIAADREMNSIRSTTDIRVEEKVSAIAPATYRYRSVSINVDARPTLLRDGKVSLRLGLQYAPNAAGESGPGMSSLNEQLGVILESGKPILLSQAADAATDRKIMVEITATILK